MEWHPRREIPINVRIGFMPFAVKVLPRFRQKGVKTAFSGKLPFSFQAAGDSFLDLFIRMTPNVAA